jgi:hypothetical protein
VTPFTTVQSREHHVLDDSYVWISSLSYRLIPPYGLKFHPEVSIELPEDT